MPLPGNLNTITLTGKFLDSTGAPLSGGISFTPPPELVDPANAIMYATAVTATLDSNGSFSVTLICTDNSALLPVGWFYTVVESVRGTRTYPIYVPHTLGMSADLSSLTPVPALDGSPAVVPSGIVAPGYGGLALNNTWTGINTFSGVVTFSGGLTAPNFLLTANDLSELTSTAATARGNLGLTALAVASIPLSIANGGTGSATQNFLDLTSAQSAAGLKTFTGGVTVPTTASVKANGVTDWFNVKSYGATGNGTTDDTTAIQNAINACHTAGGGVVYFPAGTYLVTPTGSPAIGLSLSGMQGVRLEGAGAQCTTLKKGGNGTLIQLSGAATDTTGATHCKYCNVANLAVNGNSMTGLVFQMYYADNIVLRDVLVTSNADIVLDTAECWQSRFYNLVIQSCGSATANASTPNCMLRNSAASSGFGNSTDSVNQLYFHGCRWEGFRTGAVWIQQGLGNSAGPYAIYLTDCTMETSSVNGGPHLSVDANSKDVYVKHLYAYSGGFSGGYSTAQDLITFGPQFGTLDDITLADGASATVANGITVNSPTAGDTVVVQNITATWTTAPTGALINYGTMTGAVQLSNTWANTGTLYAGTTPALNDNTPVNATTTIASSNTPTTLQSYSVPANEPFNGSVYVMRGNGVYSVTGTPTMTFATLWGSTSLVSLPLITATSGITNAPFDYELTLNFRTPTSVLVTFTLRLVTSTTTDVAQSYAATATAPITVVSNIAKTINVSFTWSAISSSNTISLLGGRTAKVA